uniref:Uncharacterized protein n=1 Tax=Anopheles atroparvus TaxID=41427 RepID=A0AAG5DKX0_ANOAO
MLTRIPVSLLRFDICPECPRVRRQREYDLTFRPCVRKHTWLRCLAGQFVFSKMRLSDNRSVMPLDVLGCTRATVWVSACLLFRKERVISETLTKYGLWIAI